MAHLEQGTGVARTGSWLPGKIALVEFLILLVQGKEVNAARAGMAVLQPRSSSGAVPCSWRILSALCSEQTEAQHQQQTNPKQQTRAWSGLRTPCVSPLVSPLVPRELWLATCRTCGKCSAVHRGPGELQLSVPFLPLQVTLLGFGGTLDWQESPGKGMLITLPYVLPSRLPPHSGWAVKLEGVK